MHEHKILYYPQTKTGYAVCECGATIRVEDGQVIGSWHSCHLCTSLIDDDDED